jgi:Flp pilus assembly protein TadB
MVHEAGSSPNAPPPVTASVREVVGVFRDETVLDATIDDLQESGFDRAEISLLASEEAVRTKLGHAYRKVGELVDDEAVRVAYVAKEDYGAAEGGLISGLVYVGALAGAGTIVASGGALGGALLAAALWGGAGGAIGVVLARWLDRQRAHKLTEQLEKGGLLLWVHARHAEHEAKAIEIMQRNGAEDVHAHDLTLAQAEAAGSGLIPHPPLLTLLESMRRRREGPGD